MRVVWIVGADPPVEDLFRKNLNLDRVGAEYTLRTASSVLGIPKDDILNPGVVILLDAFLPSHPGFEGVKHLRASGFLGPLFIFGEPAPEMSIEAFRGLNLSGFFPSFDRCDVSLAAGVIHNQLYFDGVVDFSHFLLPGGRASFEEITNFKEFSAFGVKLASFVGRFGLDINLLKKILMGLSLAHVKTQSGNPQVDQPFSIYFGLDKKKLLLGVTTLSRGITREALVNDFCEVLQTLKNPKPLPGTLFPEIFHVGRAAENLVILTGSALDPEGNLDPMMILAGLNFPQGPDKVVGRQSYFGLVQVKRTPEYEEHAGAEGLDLLAKSLNESSASELSSAQTNDAKSMQAGIEEGAVDPEALAQIESGKTESLNQPAENNNNSVTEEQAAPAVTGFSGTLATSDVSSILSDEIKITGDQPEIVDPFAAVSGSAETSDNEKAPDSSEFSSQEEDSKNSVSNQVGGVAEFSPSFEDMSETQKRLDEANKEVLRLKEMVSVMGQDVKRLMKERRTPTTDKELRDSVTLLQDKLKKTQLEKTKLEEEISDKNKLIETLKAQVDTLSKAKAA